MNVSRAKNKSGFTILELLICVVIIAILALISFIAYGQMRIKAADTSLQSDLNGASKALQLFAMQYGHYPSTIDCSQADSSTNKCLKSGGSNTFTYQPDSSAGYQDFSLLASNGDVSYRISPNTEIKKVTPLSCPSGFITVPGSVTYDTSDFCVMKYEAKADDDGDGIGDTNHATTDNTWPASPGTYPISAARKLVSTAAGYPVGLITQTAAITAASSYTSNCDTGCHLITEAEWMTIAQNVLSVPSNWSGGSVGDGYIYNGHNDNSPSDALEASADDDDSYYGTGQSSPSDQRRTLVLTNGEVIWDFAGNLLEWTNQTIAGNQQPGLSGESAYATKEWDNASLLMNGLPILSKPTSTGISSVTWNSSSRVGKLYSNYGETSEHAFLRGGNCFNGTVAGILYLHLGATPSSSSNTYGLRVAK